MATSLEELRVLQASEIMADEIWKLVSSWKPFARNIVGSQLARATDSIGANIAEAFGRFHYGDKLQFLYYARGSLFETKYWLNRSKARNLASPEQVNNFCTQLTNIARQLNAFANSLKSQRFSETPESKAKRIQETNAIYTSEIGDEFPAYLFSETELAWLIQVM